MRKQTCALLVLAAVLVWPVPPSLSAETQDAPWWDQGKIRWFWGPWGMWYPLGFPHTGHGSVDTLSDEELMPRAAAVGATVFVDRNEWTFRDELSERQIDMIKTAWQPEETRRLFLLHLRSANLNRARLARRHGLRYFGHLHSGNLPEIAEQAGARLAVNKDGKTSKEDARARGRHIPCPLDEKPADEWLFKCAEDMAQTGLVDGCHIDWEMSVSAFSYEVGDDVCYCDDCWSHYTARRGEAEDVARAERHSWLSRRGLLTDYLTQQRDRLSALYRRGAERVRAVKPDFVFSAYNGFMPGHVDNQWFIEGAAHGLHAADAPFFVIDSSHYYPNHDAPWWDTASIALRKLGMKHILGFYTSGFMGTPTMDVSAARQLYDAAISHDGYWVWFERQWGPDDVAVFRTADRLVRATENRVGQFLRDGELDHTFTTVVEQTGDPELGRRVISRAFRLGDRHLVQVNNVNTDHAVSVLVRCPRLKPGVTRIVSDPFSELCYAHDGEVTWGGEDLARGALLTLEKRSEAWLLLAPDTGTESISSSQTITADIIPAHPERPETGPVPAPGKAAAGDFPLVFARSGPLGCKSAYQPILGTSLFVVDAAGGASAEDRQVFAIKGNCWTPELSADRTRIVFSSYVNGRGQIYVVNADAAVLTGFPGRELPGKPYWVNTLPVGPREAGSFAFKAEGVNLSDNEYCDHSPVWSPDGTRIAFVSDRDGDWEIYVMNADGSGQTRLTHAPGTDRRPAWSPDPAGAGRIAFESNRGGYFGIRVIGSDGTAERVLVQRSGHTLEPVWSPDGTRIACTANHYGYDRDILVVDVETGVIDQPRGLLQAIAGWWPYTNVHSICWSPDGTHIAGAFERRTESGVFVARAASRRRAQRDAEVIIGDEFTYSSDRTEGDLVELVNVLPLKTRPGGVGAFLRHGISGGWYMGGDASNRWILRCFRDVSWSPDGSTVAFRSDMDPSGYEFFYTVPATGGEPVRLDNTLSPMGVANVPTPLNRLAAAAPADTWQPPAGAKLLAETPEFWFFRKDPDKVGEAEQWFAPSTAKAPPRWRAASIHRAWEKGYIGHGWYALDMVVPDTGDKRVWLHLDGVDENYTLWINGQYISDNMAAGPTAWDQPMSVEITGRFDPGASNHIVVRARNTAFAGGIWRPVRILIEK